MPLVRVTGSDAESFDTFDVAEMTDHRNQHSLRTGWLSRQTGGGSATAANSRHTKSGLNTTPEPEVDDLTSIDSSSGRRSEEPDRVGSMAPRGTAATRLSQSSIAGNSVGSLNSYQTPSVSLSGNSDNVQSHCNSYNSHVPLYETVDNLDEMQHDPRNPFNKNQKTPRANWGDHIPEEDETSLSTTEESSLSPSVQNQQPRYNSQQMHQPQHLRSHRHRQKLPSTSEVDDISISSHQSYRPDSNRKVTSFDNSSKILIQQLEAQVAKLNFELATTKSSLDEMQLENRRLADSKDKLMTKVTLLNEENEQLHLKIERLEKEMILRNMEGTKGRALSTTDQDSCAWSREGGTNFQSSKREFMPVATKRLGKVGGGSLEVPFRCHGNDYHLRPRRLSSCSVSSYNESVDGENSHGENDALSAHSVTLNDSDHVGDLALTDSDEPEQTGQRGRVGLLKMIGGSKRLTMVTMTKEIAENTISAPRGPRKTKKKAEADDISKALPPHQHITCVEGAGEADETDIGSNPQGEVEDFNDDDPFATWSSRGDLKREEPEQNWLQRGLVGGRVMDGKKPPLPPQSEEFIEDPFSFCKAQDDEDDDGTDGKYISFAENSYEKSNLSSGDVASGMQDRKRFGLFKGLMGGGRR